MHVMELTTLTGFLPIDTTELDAIESIAGRKRPLRERALGRAQARNSPQNLNRAG